MIKTLPNYLMVHCVIEFLDCRFLWEKVFSMNGLCYRFDIQKAIERHNEVWIFHRKSRKKIKNFQHESILNYSNGSKLGAIDKEHLEKLRKLQTLKYWKDLSVGQIISSSCQAFEFVMGLNKSDSTYGWNGAQSQLYMRISHYQKYVHLLPWSSI